MEEFNLNQIPSQKGKITIVTGANIGLGYETALALSKVDMKVIMACRDIAKAETAKEKIQNQQQNADLEVMELDLSKLASVRSFTNNFLNKYSKLDLLINNAGVMMPPFTLTEDGFELQMGVNHLGHFLLTGLLLDLVVKTPGSRIVSLSSNAHKSGKINFDDLQCKNNYSALAAYSQSKLACLMFAYELQRRLEKSGSQTISIAAHPGVSQTNLGQHLSAFVRISLTPILPFITHAPEEAAKPTLLASLGKDVKGGDYFGPTGFNQMKGKAAKVSSTALSHDLGIAKRLWEVSENLTGIAYL